MEFQEADRVPRYWPSFWSEFESEWTRKHGAGDLVTTFGTDMRLVSPDESTWPTRAGLVEQRGSKVVARTGWGELKLAEADFYVDSQVMGELLEPAISERVDPESLVFDDPLLDSRFVQEESAAAWRQDYFVWLKSGGPYLRAAFLRGEEQFWVDMIEDPEWVCAFVDRVVEHIVAVALEGLDRFNLFDSGIAIYDDVASTAGPFMGPKRYEEIFLPPLRRMINSFKEAGAAYVMHHSDGNVTSLLDMWVAAGVDAINPVEYRAGMDPARIREKYGNSLVCTGGLDNSEILPRGDRGEIRDHVLHLLQAGQGGGFVIGPHSIGPDISIATMEYVLDLLEEHGSYSCTPPLVSPTDRSP